MTANGLEGEISKVGFSQNAIDDDGTPMHLIIKNAKTGFADITGKIQPKLHNDFNETNPFLPEIPLKGEIKRTILHLLRKKGYTGKMFLRNQLNDPQLNPNDYINFESPSNLKIKWILTKCHGVTSLKDLSEAREGLIFDQQPLMEEVNEEKEIDLIIPKKPRNLRLISQEEADKIKATSTAKNEVMKKDGQEESIDELVPDNQKIQEVFQLFQETSCGKDKNCKEQHFLIGEGRHSVNDKSYTGIHIISFPDYLPIQKKLFTGYNDNILATFHQERKEKQLTADDMQRYIGAYKNRLQETIK